MPRFEPSALRHRLAERDAQILDGVVLIHVQIALGDDLQVHGPVARHQVHHVVEKTNAGATRRAWPRPSRFRRSRMSVSLVTRWMRGASHFQYFSSSLVLCRMIRAPWRRNCAARTRCASLPWRKHAEEGNARALRTPARRPGCRPDKAPTRGSLPSSRRRSPSGSRLELLHVVHGDHAARKACPRRNASACGAIRAACGR